MLVADKKIVNTFYTPLQQKVGLATKSIQMMAVKSLITFMSKMDLIFIVQKLLQLKMWLLMVKIVRVVIKKNLSRMMMKRQLIKLYLEMKMKMKNKTVKMKLRNKTVQMKMTKILLMKRSHCHKLKRTGVALLITTQDPVHSCTSMHDLFHPKTLTMNCMTIFNLFLCRR